MELIAVAMVNGARIELTLTAPDALQLPLAVNDLERRLRLMLQTEVDRAAVNFKVAQQDLVEQSKPKAPPPSRRGPDQIAAAGSKEPATIVRAVNKVRGKE